MNEELNRKELEKFANELKANGFTVIISKKHPFKWLFFEKDGQFGEVSITLGGANFGTVHKPCREAGTGFGIRQNTTLTIKNAEDCVIHAPNWATAKDRGAIRKYKSIDEFINHSSNKWAEYFIY